MFYRLDPKWNLLKQSVIISIPDPLAYSKIKVSFWINGFITRKKNYTLINSIFVGTTCFINRISYLQIGTFDRLNEIKISFTVFLSDFNETGRIIKQNNLISADCESLCLLLYYHSDLVSVKSFQIGVSNVNRCTKMNRKPEFKFIVRRESKVGHHFGVYHRYLWLILSL